MTLAPERIIACLAPVYGMPEHVPHGDAVAELILTVLSQNTADTNSGRAFVALMRRYPNWGEMAAAPVDEIASVIQPGGLAAIKAPRIVAILRAVAERSPGFDVGFLSEAPIEEARAWLRGLPGVGPKTAACVLLFALGRPAMPVDTHVERVAKRLGLIDERASSEQAHLALEALVEREEYYRFHMLLIKHGRRLCAARNPACDRCPLEPDCPASRLRADAAPSGGSQGRRRTATAGSRSGKRSS